MNPLMPKTLKRRRPLLLAVSLSIATSSLLINKTARGFLVSKYIIANPAGKARRDYEIMMEKLWSL
jgi:hypothetical protein